MSESDEDRRDALDGGGTGPREPEAEAEEGARGRRRPRREEKTRETRRRLLRAAADVVGEVGYAKATIARITLRADLALGTFYSYFDNRQELFDQLLPLMGEDMLDFIRDAAKEGGTVMEREELGIRAFFRYMVENPGFYRLLNEAETMAPEAHAAHFRNVSERYLRRLGQGVEDGELAGYAEHELEVLVYILMAARSYLVLRYGVDGNRIQHPPEWVIQTYLKFIRGGLVNAAGPEREGLAEPGAPGTPSGA
jgi:AcrR family transcriptional regulator